MALTLRSTKGSVLTHEEIDNNWTFLDTSMVKLTGNQTIDGIKTFTSTIVGNISGNSETATKLSSARSISLSGAVIGTVDFDGSSNVNVATSLTFDTTPTLNSNNPVTSGGLYTVLGDIASALDTINGEVI